MKVLKKYGGKEYMLDDDEAQHIVKVKNSGKKAFIQLRSGNYVDTPAIESLDNPPLVAVSAEGYPLSKDGNSFIRNGQRVYVEDRDGIHYVEDPRYQKLAEKQFEIAEREQEINKQEKELPDNKREGKIKKFGNLANKKYNG